MSSAAPPTEPRQLAAWFAEGVDAEVAELEKKGGERRYELHGGQRVSPEESPYVIYRFTMADDGVVPEDASGIIEIDSRPFKARITSQETSRLDVEIEGGEEVAAFVPRAILRVDDLGLLRKLAEVLRAVASGTESVSPLTSRIFHASTERVNKEALPLIPALAGDRVSDEQRDVLEQAIGSEITYVWGPPGTGKTYVIAHLIAALAERGERVLMTSHTHAAIDEAMYKAADPLGCPGGGPLAHSALVREGKVIRIGDVPRDSKVPEYVRLEYVEECRSQGIRAEIGELDRKAKPLSARRAEVRAQLAAWNRFSQLVEQLSQLKAAFDGAEAARESCRQQERAAQEAARDRESALDQAKRAWFFGYQRTQRAEIALRTARATLQRADEELSAAQTRLKQISETALAVQEKAREQRAACAGLPTQELLEQQISALESQLHPIEARLAELTTKLDRIRHDVIAEARVVSATLTRCYVGDELEDQSFDALIVDEISMALPPLLFVAARRALRRAILVGDFKQLPPIVRSDSQVSRDRLATDAFSLSGLVDGDLEPVGHSAMAQLCIQRRMVPPIADAARRISYRNRLVDDPAVWEREPPDWMAFLPDSPLVVVDTADLHCWSGRQAGSLSRFNLYSAQIAVELAAMAASNMLRPEPGGPSPVGVVTPYAAQAHLLRRLAEALGLDDWVRCGTVHTFQGGEAELIVFDTVLDEPFFTARLCNPKDAKEVKRDLNVALTRARMKFVLLGSSEWLNRHASPPSGLGQLWQCMKDYADLVSAVDLVEVGFAGRVAGPSSFYRVPADADGPAHEILDENSFFERFAADLMNAHESVFGLVPYFGEYRWPKIEPLIRHALERGVEVTLVTPPPADAQNRAYVQKAIRSLRQFGAVVVGSTGLHGKDTVIDSRIHYTGSLNWASHRGRAEIMHRTDNEEWAKKVLEYLQARHIRSASQQGDRPRTCPMCHGPTQVVNQARPMAPWDKQPMKLACVEYQDTGCRYAVGIDERPPFLEPPRCEKDGRTKYRRVKRRRGEVWECPKHPKECERFKVVLGDPPQ